MGCIYSNGNESTCSMFDIGTDDLDRRPQGCGEDGGCMVEEDPIPANNCELYETDSGCFNCGADYNQDEDCTCGEKESQDD